METWGVILRSRSDVYTGNLQQDHCQSDTQVTGAGGGKDGKKPAPADEACPGQI